MDSPSNYKNEEKEDSRKGFGDKESNSDRYRTCDDPMDSNERSKLIAAQDGDNSKPNVPKTQQNYQDVGDLTDVTGPNQPLIDKKDSLAKYSDSNGEIHSETLRNDVTRKQSGDSGRDENIDDQDENLSSSESYPASSHHTENTDSVTGGFGLSNRVSIHAVYLLYVWKFPFDKNCTFYRQTSIL